MVLRLSALIILAGVVVGCKGASNTAVADENYVPDGEKLYQKNCIACHGGDGTLGKAGSKNLKESTLTTDQVHKMIELGGGNGMPRFKEILGREGEMDAVVEYVMQMRGR